MAASHLMQKASLRQVPVCCQKTWALHAGPLLVHLTCSKPVCRESLRLATCVAAASSVSRQRLGKDRLQFHLFIKYSKNRTQIQPHKIGWMTMNYNKVCFEVGKIMRLCKKKASEGFDARPPRSRYY